MRKVLRLAVYFLAAEGLLHVALTLGSVLATISESASPFAIALYSTPAPVFTITVSPLAFLLSLVSYSRMHRGIPVGGWKVHL